jgi:hypothetical protein
MTQRYTIAESPSGVGIVAPVDYVLVSNGDGTWNVAPQGGGGGGVTTWNTRNGDVVPEFADYGTNLILNQSSAWESSVLTAVLDQIATTISNVLPAVNTSDNGKVLVVTAGAWDKGFQYPIQFFETVIDDVNFAIDSPPGTTISPILPAGQYLVTLNVNNVNSNAAGEFSIQVGTVAPGTATTMFTIVPNQGTGGGGPNTYHQGQVILESDGTDGLRFAQTEITPLVGTSHMRFSFCVTRLK